VVRSKFRPDGNGCITNEKLDEVLRDAVEKRDLYASAGRAGGKKRAENAKSRPPSSHPQATLEPPLSEAQATLKHKRRVEESRGEKTRGAVNPPLEDPAPLSSSTTDAPDEEGLGAKRVLTEVVVFVIILGWNPSTGLPYLTVSGYFR
jgi:hypothetical protein